MLKKLMTLAAGAVAAAVTACGDAPRTTVRYRDPAGSFQFMQWAASRGPLLATIHGTAFPGERPERTAEVALGAMGRAIAEYKTLRFTTDPAQAGDRRYHVTLAFNAPRRVSGRALCRGEVPPEEPGERLTVLAVFCEEDRVLTDVAGSVGGDPEDLTLDSERFRQLMVQVSQSLFRDKP